MELVVLTLLVAIAVYVVAWRVFDSRTHMPLPPGPRGLPIVGNALQYPLSEAWKTFTQWKNRYGDIVYISLFGTPVVILNTADVADELMNRRAANYSDRPNSIMVHKLMGWDWVLTARSGDLHRQMRSLAQRYFVHQVKQYQAIQTEEALILAERCISAPNDVFSHIHFFAACIVLRIGYGYRLQSVNDPFLKESEKAIENSALDTTLVDIFPILQYWPEWLPGGGFKTYAREGREAMEHMRDIPFAHTKERLKQGTAEPCFVTVLLDGIDPSQDIQRQETLIRDTVGTMYGAGAHSTSSSLKTFMLAMMLFPEVQRHAQDEIDRVTGGSRLPTMDDRKDLPYIEALLTEILRWNSVTPSGFPHKTVTEDQYRGYRIPAGTVVLGNMWAILRDPAVFPDPERFDPMRYIDIDGKKRAEIVDVVFGWGRRVCPGKELAQASIFISVAILLSTITISLPLTKEGQEYTPDVKWTTVHVREPMPFSHTITPRPLQSKVLRDHFAY
ncbi:cytochrome P450 [Panus rudis PR-1116 ss-1]|nr:cytochrome P450 [Panus rudis PR-1116 ss-1]